MSVSQADLHKVQASHYAIHERLENWAAYVRDSFSKPNPSPMFRYYRPYRVARQPEVRVTPDSRDGALIERQVSLLPASVALAIRWAYVFPWRDERKLCRVMEIQRVELLGLIEAGRQILKERLTLTVVPTQNPRKFDSPSGATTLLAEG